MEIKLVVVSGKNAGQVVPVSGQKFFIGRAEDCSLRPYSDLVSRHHCAILSDQGFAAVRDFGSKNGTFVNGERIRTEHELKNGDHLKVGDLEFEVQLSVEVAGKKKPRVRSVQEAAARTADAATREAATLDEDLDLVGLIGEDTGSVAADSDTRTRQVPRPASVPAPPPSAPPAANSPVPAKANQQPAEPAKQPANKPAKKGPQPLPKADAPSSRDAAAAMLKNFFKGF